MNKFSSLIDNINKFSQITISRYQFKKMASEMTMDDFNNNHISYNTSGEYPEINNIKEEINQSIKNMSVFSMVIEDIVGGKVKDKLDIVSGLADAMRGVVRNYRNITTSVNKLNEVPDSYSKFMESETGGSGSPDPVDLIDFLLSGYKAIDDAVFGMTGFTMDHFVGDASLDEEQSEGEEAFEDAGAVGVGEVGQEGYQYSSDDNKKREDYKYLKIKREEAKEIERTTGETPELLRKTRAAAAAWRKELREDPERFKAFKENQKVHYEKTRQVVEKNYNTTVKQLMPAFIKYNLLNPDEEITYRKIYDMVMSLRNIVKQDLSKEGREIDNLIREFGNPARILQRTERDFSSVKSYDEALDQGVKTGHAPALLVKFNQRLSKNHIKSNKALINEIKEENKSEIERVSNLMSEAVENKDVARVKELKKEITNIINAGLDKHIKIIKSQIEPNRKALLNIYGRGAVKDRRPFPQDRVAEVIEILNDSTRIVNEFGPKYPVVREWLPKIIKAITDEIRGDTVAQQ